MKQLNPLFTLLFVAFGYVSSGNSMQEQPKSSAGAQTFIATATSVKPSVQDKLSETVNVRDFGAVGDGTTDDTSSISAARLAAARTHAEVFYPPATYHVATILMNTIVAGTEPRVSDGVRLTDGTNTYALSARALANTFTDTITPIWRHRSSLQSRVRATEGGNMGGWGNSTHDNFFLINESTTPTEALNINYVVRNYASGDAGFGAGVTQTYGHGLTRGMEHNSLLGNLQFQATLGMLTFGQNSLPYTSPLNEETLGVGRELIDVSIRESTGSVASFNEPATRATVVGRGTNFTRALVGQFFKMDADDRTLGGCNASAWYRITAVIDATHLQLENNYAGTVTSGTYSISPGAAVIGFDANAKTINVEQNSVAWKTGDTVVLGIDVSAQLSPFVGIIGRSLPYVSSFDSAFRAMNVGSETVGAAFTVDGPGKFDTGISFAGTNRIGINAGSATIIGDHFMEIPIGKRISWGDRTTSTLSPGITAETDGSVSLYSLGEKILSSGDTGVFAQRGFVENKVQLSSNPSTIAINAKLGNWFVCDVMNTNPHSFAAPTNAQIGQRITITVRNLTSAALGITTFNSIFKIAAYSSPASGENTTADFRYDGANWVQVTSWTSGIPN